MIRKVIAADLSSLTVVRHHDIIGCNIDPAGSVITICVIHRTTDSNAEQNLPLIKLLTILVDTPDDVLFWET